MLNIAFTLSLAAGCAFAQSAITIDRKAAMKADLAGQIDAMKKQAHVMVDSVYSFAELGFQEFETSKYLTGILEKPASPAPALSPKSNPRTGQRAAAESASPYATGPTQ
jgi:hypothetical protein